MDPETKKLLEDTYHLVEENNKMLHKVRGVQKRATLFSVFYWIVIIGVSVGAFYFLQPYVDGFRDFVTETNSTFDKFKSFLPNSN